MNYVILKLFAMFFMLIDHIGFVFLQNEETISQYIAFRRVGRLAFPIFCFLIVNGYLKTSNKFNYIKRLGLFAIISEPFFDVGFFNELTLEHQNVFFTLTFGFIVMMAIDKIKELFYREEHPIASNIIIIMFSFPIVGFFAALGEELNIDYGWFGVLLISLMHFVYPDNSKVSKIKVCIMIIIANIIYAIMIQSTTEMYSILSIFFILLYNDKKVKVNKFLKYFFYAFYPLHIFILYLIHLIV